ncbi:hypothetical protein AVEN_163600-1 [Araneus ventricosus]|uniref:Uncharacterized protein n=1 Tax=Araneus ventricosus TaxID=182803 RepID=A0A4Y2QBP9_ARAVE|nr:hypothetical protein AVEN_163600-1 [Araneus ventricosus]
MKEVAFLQVSASDLYVRNQIPQNLHLACEASARKIHAKDEMFSRWSDVEFCRGNADSGGTATPLVLEMQTASKISMQIAGLIKEKSGVALVKVSSLLICHPDLEPQSSGPRRTIDTKCMALYDVKI